MKARCFICACFLASCGLLHAQTNTFPSSGDVGIGTTSPGANLHIAKPNALLFLQDTNSDGRTYSLGSRWGGYFTIFDETFPSGQAAFSLRAGNAGFGITAPSVPLQVLSATAGEIARFEGKTDASNARNYLSLYTTNPNFWWEFSSQDSNGGGAQNGLAFNERSGSGDSLPRVYFASGGNVGIGTTNPTQKLSVNGTIQAKEVIVQTGWSDYVFAPDYKLAPLSEVESHIKAEGHLPGIPSAKEVAEHGVSMGEIQSKLLAKIEELTLHVIEQEKRQAEQENAIQRILEENKQLRAEISDSAKP